MSAPATSSPAALRLARLDLAQATVDPAVAARLDRLVRRGAVPDPVVRYGARRILAEIRSGGRISPRCFGPKAMFAATVPGKR